MKIISTATYDPRFYIFLVSIDKVYCSSYRLDSTIMEVRINLNNLLFYNVAMLSTDHGVIIINYNTPLQNIVHQQNYVRFIFDHVLIPYPIPYKLKPQISDKIMGRIIDAI